MGDNVFNIGESVALAKSIAKREGIRVSTTEDDVLPHARGGNIVLPRASLYNHDEYMEHLHTAIGQVCPSNEFFDDVSLETGNEDKDKRTATHLSIIRDMHCDRYMNGEYQGRDRQLASGYKRRHARIDRHLEHIAHEDPTAAALLYAGNQCRNQWQGYNKLECPPQAKEVLDRMPELENKWMSLETQEDLEDLLKYIQETEQDGQSGQQDGQPDDGEGTPSEGGSGEGTPSDGGEGSDGEGSGDQTSSDGAGSESEGEGSDSDGDAEGDGDSEGEGDDSEGDSGDDGDSNGDSGGGEDSDGESGDSGDQESQAQGADSGGDGSGGENSASVSGDSDGDGDEQDGESSTPGFGDAGDSVRNLKLIGPPPNSPQPEMDNEPPYRPGIAPQKIIDARGSHNGHYGTSHLLKELDGFKLSKKVRRYLIAMAQTRYEYGLRQGRIATSKISKMYSNTGYEQPRMFKKQQASQLKTDVAMSLIVDQSGSMEGRKFRIASACAIGMSEVLQAINVPHEIVTFTTRGGLIINTIMKSYDERFVAREALAKRFTRDDAYMGANADGESIMWAVSRMVKRPEKEKVAIVCSDGSPAFSRSGGDGRRYLKDVVKCIEETRGMDILGIGIEDNSVRRYYTRHRVLNNLASLETVFMDLIKEKVLS